MIARIGVCHYVQYDFEPWLQSFPFWSPLILRPTYSETHLFWGPPILRPSYFEAQSNHLDPRTALTPWAKMKHLFMFMCMCTTLQHSITMHQIPIDCIIWRKSCCLNTKNLSSGANLQAGVCTTSTSWFWLQCCTLIVFAVVCCFQEGVTVQKCFKEREFTVSQAREVHCSEMFLKQE